MEKTIAISVELNKCLSGTDDTECSDGKGITEEVPEHTYINSEDIPKDSGHINNSIAISVEPNNHLSGIDDTESCESSDGKGITEEVPEHTYINSEVLRPHSGNINHYMTCIDDSTEGNNYINCIADSSNDYIECISSTKNDNQYITCIDDSAEGNPYIQCIDDSAEGNPYIQCIDDSAEGNPYIQCIDDSAEGNPYIQCIDDSIEGNAYIQCINDSVEGNAYIQCIDDSIEDDNNYITCIDDPEFNKNYITCIDDTTFSRLHPGKIPQKGKNVKRNHLQGKATGFDKGPTAAEREDVYEYISRESVRRQSRQDRLTWCKQKFCIKRNSLLASCVAVLLLCVGFNLFIWLPSDSFQLPTEAATARAISAEHTTSSQLTTASPEATISDFKWQGITMWANESIIYKDNEAIVFKALSEVSVNPSYNASTGNFTCEEGGVYFVTATFVANSQGLEKEQGFEDKVKIATYKGFGKGKKIMMSIIEYKPSPNTVSNSALVECTKADTIHMEAFDQGFVYGHPEVPSSTFTVIQVSQKGDKAFVGFSAYYTGNNKLVRPSHDTNVRFGGYLYKKHNRFACPLEGTYYVSANLQSDDSTKLDAAVAKNYEPIVYMHYEKDNKKDVNTITNSCLVTCRQGDNVTVLQLKGGKNTINGYRGLPYTTFTIMLLNIKDKSVPFEGVSVYKTTTDTYTEGDPITFEGQILAVNNLFNVSEYRCPKNGAYFLSLNVKKVGLKDTSVDLMCGKVTVFRLRDIGGKFRDNQISNSAVVQCRTGEAIGVIASGAGTVVYGHLTQAHTTFTAFPI